MSGRSGNTSKPKEEEERSFFLREDLHSATLVRLVEALTAAQEPETYLIAPLTLVYRAFTSGDVLLSLLIRRYTSEEAQSDPKHLIQMRVLAFLKIWLQNNYDEDFLLDPTLKQQLLQFLTMESNAEAFIGKTARNLLAMLSRSDVVLLTPISAPEPSPAPLLCKRLPPTCLADIPPQELARQLTLMEYPLFRNIRSAELIHTAWTKPNKEQQAPNVLANIRWFNRISYWTITEVLKQRQLRDRVAAIRRIVRLAGYLREMQSFSMMQAVMSALISLPVGRLTATWEELCRSHKKSNSRFQELKLLCSPAEAYKRLRQAVKDAGTRPCIPHLGVFLSSLVLIEESPDMDGSDVNFSKQFMIARYLEQIKRYQQNPFNFERVPEIQEYINTFQAFAHDNAFDVSLELEPPPTPEEQQQQHQQPEPQSENRTALISRTLARIASRSQRQQPVAARTTANITPMRVLSIYTAPNRQPIHMLSAKHGIIACIDTSSQLLQVCHLETGQVLTVLENAPNLQYKYLQGVIYYTTDNFTLVATSLRDGDSTYLAGHTDWITDFIVTPEFACTASADKTCVVWPLGEQLAPSAKGPATKRKVVLSGHKKPVQCVQMRTAVVVLSGSSDNTIKLWNRDTGACLGTLSGHDGPVKTLAVVHYDTLFSGSDDGTVRMWDLTNPAQRSLKVFHVGAPLLSARMNPTHRYLVIATKDGVQAFNLQSGVRTLHIQAQALGRVNSLTLHEERAVTGSEDAGVRVWQLEDGQCVLIGDAHADSVTCVEVSDGVVYSASLDGSVRAWQLEPGVHARTLSLENARELSISPAPDEMSGQLAKLLAGHMYIYAEAEHRRLARIDSSAAIDLRVDASVFPAVLDMYRFESSVVYQMLATEMVLSKLVPLLDSADVKALALSFNSLASAHKSFVRDMRDLLQAWGQNRSLAQLYASSFVPLHRYEEYVSCFLLALPFFRVNHLERPFLDRLKQADTTLAQFLSALMAPIVELFRRKSLIENSWEQLDDPHHVSVLHSFHSSMEEFLARFLERSAGSELTDLPSGRSDEHHLIRAQRASRKYSAQVSVSRDEDKRTQVTQIHLLANAETEFVMQTRAVIEGYKKPLMERRGGEFLTANEINPVFNLLEVIVPLHVRFDQLLQLCVAPVPLYTIAEVFLKMVPDYDVYSEYLGLVALAKRTLSIAMNRSEPFRQWLFEHSQIVAAHQPSENHLMWAICEAPLEHAVMQLHCIEKLINCSEKKTPGHMDLARVTVVWKKLIRWMLNSLETASSTVEMQLLQRMIGIQQLELTSAPNRRLVRKGEATVSPGGKNRHIIVFNDMCLVMKQQGSRYLTEHILELRGAKVQGDADKRTVEIRASSNLITASTASGTGSTASSLLMTFRSEAESVSWLMTFNRIVAKLSQGVFEVPLAQLLEWQKRELPAHVEYIVEHLRRSALTLEGLFCYPATQTAMYAMKNLIDKADITHVRLWSASPHLAATLLYEYFHGLPQPLLPLEVVLSQPVSMSADPVRFWANVLLECPLESQRVLVYVLRFAQQVAAHSTQNGVSLDDLALMFGTALLRPAVEAFDSVLQVPRVASWMRVLMEHLDEVLLTLNTVQARSKPLPSPRNGPTRVVSAALSPSSTVASGSPPAQARLSPVRPSSEQPSSPRGESALLSKRLPPLPSLPSDRSSLHGRNASGSPGRPHSPQRTPIAQSQSALSGLSVPTTPLPAAPKSAELMSAASVPAAAPLVHPSPSPRVQVSFVPPSVPPLQLTRSPQSRSPQLVVPHPPPPATAQPPVADSPPIPSASALPGQPRTPPARTPSPLRPPSPKEPKGTSPRKSISHHMAMLTASVSDMHAAQDKGKP